MHGVGNGAMWLIVGALVAHLALRHVSCDCDRIVVHKILIAGETHHSIYIFLIFYLSLTNNS